MNPADLVGQQIKRGRPGVPPRITRVIWMGTAELMVGPGGPSRRPAAWVNSTHGDFALVQLAGSEIEQDRWWDARIFPQREWESEDGQLLSDTDREIAAAVERFLAGVEAEHLSAYEEIRERIRTGRYGVATVPDR